MEVSDAKKLRALEEREPAAEGDGSRSQLGQGCTDDGDPKKRLELVERPAGCGAGDGRATCSPSAMLASALEVDRLTYYRYEPRPDRNAQLREALLMLAKEQLRYGYCRPWALLVRQGWEVDVKRIHRLYKAEGLMVRPLKRKRLSRPVSANPLLVRRNQEWAMDFVSDALATGRALRTFTLIDSYTKESLAIEVNTGISSRQVARVLERVIEERGAPGSIRCDNGPEFTSLYLHGMVQRPQHYPGSHPTG